MPHTEREILDEIRSVQNDLSPENLSCDGELSRSRTRRKENVLLTRLRGLERELGRKPTEQEIWNTPDPMPIMRQRQKSERMTKIKCCSKDMFKAFNEGVKDYLPVLSGVRLQEECGFTAASLNNIRQIKKTYGGLARIERIEMNNEVMLVTFSDESQYLCSGFFTGYEGEGPQGLATILAEDGWDNVENLMTTINQIPRTTRGVIFEKVASEVCKYTSPELQFLKTGSQYTELSHGTSVYGLRRDQLGSHRKVDKMPAFMAILPAVIIVAKWSGPTPLPVIGTKVKVKLNAIGIGTIVAYFIETGYLGVEVRLTEQAESHQKQCGVNSNPLVFGSEIEV